MRKLTLKDILVIAGVLIMACAIFQGWSSVVAFLGILLTAIMPLIVGTAIAYVVAIPTNFLERHFLPNNTSVQSRVFGVPYA